MMTGRPKGQIDMQVLEELADFLSKRGGSEEMGAEPGEDATPAVEVEIGAAPAEGMAADNTCPHCGKSY